MDVARKLNIFAFKIIASKYANANESFTLKTVTGSTCFHFYGLVNVGVGEGKKVSNTADVGA